MPTTPKPELLAPAGTWECARAAVENGADAIYFGLDCGFNARARAGNFHIDDLPELMSFLHRRAVRGYVTFNTLVFPSELPRAARLIQQIAAAGTDAILVQDIGIARLIRAICPQQPIHASTQMTLTSAEAITMAKLLDVERVVLARELSIAEIEKIHQQTDVPLETFAHGALCVAYSGQCLTSESLGGRSANRGQCAQACRLPYDLVCDGEDVELGDVKYLLSPQDLAAFELVPEMLEAGVCSFKIEGRLKTPEYVANITRHYRRAIDDAYAGYNAEFSSQDVREMELSFSRGFSPGWLNGCDHKMLVPGESSAKRGVLLGTVKAVCGRRIEVELLAPIALGDGIVLAGDRIAGEEQGGRVIKIYVRDELAGGCEAGQRAEIVLDRRAVDLSVVEIDQQVWKTDDPQLTQRLRKSFTGKHPLRRVPLALQVFAAVGQRLTIEGVADNGATCCVSSDQPLEAARKHAASHELLSEQLGRLGGTIFQLANLTAEIVDEPMVPLSVLGSLRRTMLNQLDATAGTKPKRDVGSPATLDTLRSTLPTEPSNSGVNPKLRILCRTLDQLHAAIDAGVTHTYADFADIRQYRQAVQVARSSNIELYLATPRIQKPDEVGIFRTMLRHEPDGILVRNLGGLAFFAEHKVPFVADFSLNVANELTAQFFHEQGARRIVTSYDLNREQILDLVDATPSSWLEIVIHQHMPMFHMEHCVFCAVLSPGTNKHNCGRPCDDHVVHLRDRVGMEHRLTADVGCRNTLFNAVPQSSAEVVPVLLERGVRDFRIELLADSTNDVQRIVRLYNKLLHGRVTGKEVWQQLKATNRVGVTRGTLEERRNPLAIL